jgi:hypothetical protein
LGAVGNIVLEKRWAGDGRGEERRDEKGTKGEFGLFDFPLLEKIDNN